MPAPLSFADHFSKLAPCYGKHRPRYPEELFEVVAASTPRRHCAWDAGTGSGQAAVRLARYFEKVIATDASEAQIANAWAHPRVVYRVEAAESSTFEDRSLDLVTAAHAAHWFRVEAFYEEVRRVLRPGGVLALWCYGLESVDDEVNVVIEKLYIELLGDFWPKRTLIDHTYQDIPFPFAGISRRVFRMHMEWTLEQLLDGFRTWSAVARYKERHAVDPVALLRHDFCGAWGDPEAARRVTWPVYLRLGSVT